MNTKKNSLNNPLKLAINFAKIFFILGILFSIFIIIYATYKIYNPPEDVSNKSFYYFSIIIGLIFSILFSLILKLNNNLKVNISLVFFSIISSVFLFEIYLESFWHKKELTLENKIEIAKQKNIEYDKRTSLEVLNDLNNSGIKSFPRIAPNLFIITNGLKTKNGNIYPLGGISNTVTILSNELGYYPIIQTDEYGFNNPKGLYNKKDVDILLVGDSFVAGYSVHSNENIGSYLREFGFNTISIGKADNGPLIEYASLREYAEKLEPKIVLWFYYNNDFENIAAEMKSPILMEYFNNDNFSQKLILRQSEIDSLLKDFVLQKMQNTKNTKNNNLFKKENLFRILKLSNLRNKLKIKPKDDRSKIFTKILKKSKKTVSKWQGEIYLIYLPSINRYLNHKYEDAWQKEFLKSSKEAKISVINMHQEVFSIHPEPLSLFPPKEFGHHYNANGYFLIAKLINEKIKNNQIKIND